MKTVIVLFISCVARLCSCGLESSFSFDVSNPDRVKTTLTSKKYSGIEHDQYSVDEEYTVTEVRDGGTTIRKITEGEKCTAIDLYSKGDEKFLVVWVFSGTLQLLRFEKNGTEWNPITKKDFDNKLSEISPEASQDADAYQSTSLNIANPDKSKVDVSEREEHGVTYKTYSLNDNVYVSSIVENKLIILTSGGGKKLKSAQYHFYDRYAFLTVDSIDLGSPTSEYFRKENGKWVPIEKEKYDRKLKELLEQAADVAKRVARDDEETSDSEAPSGDADTQSSKQTEHDPSNRGVVDISIVNSPLCLFIDYTFASNAIKLVVPRNDVSVTKLMNGKEEIYTLSSGETFEYARVYLNKGAKSELVFVVTRTSSEISRKAYCKSGHVWRNCSNYDAQMKNSRVSAEWISNFEVDLASTTDTYECTVFQVALLGITTKQFYPKPGYMAIEVKDGNKVLWHAEKPQTLNGTLTGVFGGYNGYCRSCIISENGDMMLLEMALFVDESMVYKYFEKTTDGKWAPIEKKDYEKKLGQIKQHYIKNSKPREQANPNEKKLLTMENTE
ncbi:hypothetical protein BEWA_038370 [Theileria equi strain WA]|uniref:Signal peptide containing protein n=1 Tax=Theileria equi strain WA TaxID=1537102 RepID=L1LEZ6_THEEQ|nr:hypothetical protein BEWA_038370 [Theileria equi strain WA]EKX73800.1 hypothetical protein BEWA_038370 [Theileria equi strain WA]|eukprot:XP_004833252.1 hypothetical protein BEWA_038370 [Theileria equi strain WA]